MAVFPSFGADPSIPLLAQCNQIIDRITILLSELDQLKAAIEKRPATGHKPLSWNQAVPGLGFFERLVLSERKHLEKMVTAYDDENADVEKLDSKTRLSLDASNCKFYETVWEITKRCRDLTGMRRELTWRTEKGRGVNAVIDLVVNGGADWIKVVTTTERRLFYEMADAGWDWDEDFADPEAEEAMMQILRDETEDSIEVARVARQMVAAARTSYQDYRRPRVRLLMSRIEEGRNEQVDRLLRLVRRMGDENVELVVETANSSPGILTDPTPAIEEAVTNLINTDYFRDFTETLNVECSVFMALSSDLSHMSIGPESGLLRSKQHRIDATDEVENGPRLVTTLYPAMRGRKLVCTQEAADTFLKIVYEIGTETEQARARILFDQARTQGEDDDNVEGERRKRVEALQELSTYPVPEDLCLPIEVAGSVSWEDAHRMVERGELPPVALAAGHKGSGLNAMNVSSFLYGWKAGITTITGNWEAAKRLRSVVEGAQGAGNWAYATRLESVKQGKRDDVGPHIWRIPFSRNLLAKPKGQGAEKGRLKGRFERKVEKERSLQSWTGDDEARVAEKPKTGTEEKQNKLGGVRVKYL